MSPATYIMNNQYKGDTFDVLQFTLLNTVDLTPIDITGATVDIKFRKKTITGAVIYSITNGAGVTVTDATNGVFQIDSFLLDWDASIYYYDVQLSFVGGIVKTYIKGTITIIQDITYG